MSLAYLDVFALISILKHWKHQIEWDIENSDAIELSAEEWSLVQEGIADYKSGNIQTFEDFISIKTNLSSKY